MNISGALHSLVNAASAAQAGSVQGVAAVSMLKKSMDAQQNAAAQLIAALPQPTPAAGGLGAHVDVYA